MLDAACLVIAHILSLLLNLHPSSRYLYNHRTNEAWKEYRTDDGEVLPAPHPAKAAARKCERRISDPRVLMCSHITTTPSRRRRRGRGPEPERKARRQRGNGPRES